MVRDRVGDTNKRVCGLERESVILLKVMRFKMESIILIKVLELLHLIFLRRLEKVSVIKVLGSGSLKRESVMIFWLTF